MRKELDHAVDLFEAALELAPSAERLEEYKRVRKLSEEAAAAGKKGGAG
jgi:hypothetical protein